MSPTADPNDPNPYGVKVVPIERKESTRAEHIKGTVKDLVADFLYYGRKEDEDLPVGEIEAAIRCGEITVDEICELFSSEVRTHIGD